MNLKWKKQQISITEANQLIQLDFHLPSDVKKVRGVLITINDDLSSVNSEILHLGELSLSFNNKNINPIHTMVSYYKNPNNKKQSLLLDIEVEKGQIVSGYFIDNGKSITREDVHLNYSVNVYLECETK